MSSIFNNDNLWDFGESALYFLIAFGVFFLGKIIFQLLHPKINVKDELVEKDNLAFSVAHTGYLIGLLFVLGSAIVGDSHGLWVDIQDLVIYGFLGIILLNLSTFINDKLILRKFSVHKEIIHDQNPGAGVVEGANAVASGLIIFGAISGGEIGLLNGILSSIFFWSIGQVIMILVSFIYELITDYNVSKEIEKDNVAAGVAFAGVIVAFGNLIYNGIEGTFDTWQDLGMSLSGEILLGIILLPVVRFATDKLLLPGQRLSDEIARQEKPNVGAGIIEAFSYIGGSVLVTWII